MPSIYWPTNCLGLIIILSSCYFVRHVERVFIADVVSIVYRRSRMKKSDVVTSETTKESGRFGRRKQGNDEEDQDIDAKVSRLHFIRRNYYRYVLNVTMIRNISVFYLVLEFNSNQLVTRPKKFLNIAHQSLIVMFSSLSKVKLRVWHNITLGLVM